MATTAELVKDIRTSAHTLGLKHPRVVVTKEDRVFCAGLTHIENGIEVLYVSVSDENFTSKGDALSYLNSVLVMDIRKGVSVGA